MAPGSTPPTSASEKRTRGVSDVWLQALLALLLGGWGVVVMMDSIRMGMGWSTDGPGAGFFSFWIGAMLTASSAAILVRALFAKTGRSAGTVFGVTELKSLAAILVPVALIVLAMRHTGVYVAIAAYIAGAARFEAHLSWWASLGLAVASAVALFGIFTVGFDVPLPIGPIERSLGY